MLFLKWIRSWKGCGKLTTISSQDYEELKARHVLQAGMTPAALHLERNLISNYLKQQLSSRPAEVELRERGRFRALLGLDFQTLTPSLSAGIILPQDTSEQHAAAAAMLKAGLESRCEDAKWRAKPEELVTGHK
jgi:hypothetical protein